MYLVLFGFGLMFGKWPQVTAATAASGVCERTSSTLEPLVSILKHVYTALNCETILPPGTGCRRSGPIMAKTTAAPPQGLAAGAEELLALSVFMCFC